ncbi:MAG TPA: sulfotransferase [Rhizomicrobium sp.]|jgi:hypothetical protein|nr:sulfotransferase [Rhizomicrobium sp.]
MLVLCNGMPRSASTWSFNVVVKLLRACAVGEVHGGYDENVGRFLKNSPACARHLVLKYHNEDPVGSRLVQAGAARAIYTRRDPADATVSFMTMFGVDFGRAVAVIADSLRMYRTMADLGQVLALDYAAIMNDPPAAVRHIANHLELPVPSEILAEVAAATGLAATRLKVEELGAIDAGHRLIRRGPSAYDPGTLLNIDHIRDAGIGYGARVLSDAQLQQLHELCHGAGDIGG